MNDDQLKLVTERLDQIQRVVNQIDRDLSTDRRDLQDFSIRVGACENQLEELRKLVSALPQRTKDRVEDAVQPIVDETRDLKEEINKKRTLAVKPKRRFWFF